jgi:hypothetical protein
MTLVKGVRDPIIWPNGQIMGIKNRTNYGVVFYL